MSVNHLLKSTLLIGSASSLSIVIGIIRAKLLVLMVGPAGVGIMGLLSNIQGVGVALAGMGLPTVGVRQLSAMPGRTKALARVRRILLLAIFIQSLILVALLWGYRTDVARMVFDSEEQATNVGLMGIGVVFGLISVYQMTVFKGLRRIGDYARVTIWAALVPAIAALSAVYFLGTAGIVWFVILQSVVAAGVGAYFLRKSPPADIPPGQMGVFAKRWGQVAVQGLPYMITMFMPMASVLVIRSMITHEMGLDFAGYFHAAWTITLQYIGVLLIAMGTDYFPRLSEVIRDRPRAITLVNDQLQVALALGGPIMIGLIGFAPVVLVLFFSAEFTPAVPTLQWQTLGNIPKIAVWCLGFILITQGRSIVFFTTELFFNLIFLGLSWWLLRPYGLEAVGIGFLIGYLLTAVLMHSLVAHYLDFSWDRASFALLAMHMAAATVTLLAAQQGVWPGIAASVVLGAATGLIGLRALIARIGTSHKFIRPIAAVFARLGWPLDKPAP